MSSSTQNSFNIIDSLSESDRSLSTDSQKLSLTKKKQILLNKSIIKDTTRYYYNTFDSSTDKLDEYTYSYKREFDLKTANFNYIQNPQKFF